MKEGVPSDSRWQRDQTRQACLKARWRIYFFLGGPTKAEKDPLCPGVASESCPTALPVFLSGNISTKNQRLSRQIHNDKS